MSIIVSCDCGKRLRARDEDAGKRAKCPGCGKALVVGQKDEEGLYDLSEPPPQPSARPTPAQTTAVTMKAPVIARPAAVAKAQAKPTAVAQATQIRASADS